MPVDTIVYIDGYGYAENKIYWYINYWNGPIVNMDAWYEAFDVKEGDKLYKPKEKRTKIW